MERSTLFSPMRIWKRSVAGPAGAGRTQLVTETPTGSYPVWEDRGLAPSIRVHCTDQQRLSLRSTLESPRAGARIRAVGLLRSLGLSQSDISALLEIPRSEVARMCGFASLPPQVLAYLDAGQLSLSHARELLKVSDPVRYATRAVVEGLSFRALRSLIRDPKSTTSAGTSDLAFAESELTRYLQSPLSLSRDGRDEIVIDIRYTGLLVLLGLLESFGRLNPETGLTPNEPARLCRIVLSERDLDTLVRALPPI